MLLSNGLARLNGLLLAFILLFQATVAPFPLEARSRKGEKIYKDAQLAEGKGQYEEAYKLYEQALAEDPRDSGYRLGLNRVRFQASMKLVDQGEKLRNQGKLEEALKLFQKAFALDPASAIAEQRMRQTYDQMKKQKEREARGEKPEPIAEMNTNTNADRVRRDSEKKLDTVLDAPFLKPIKREIVNLKINPQPARVLYETVSKMAGINVIFDPDFITQNSGRTYPADFQNTTLEEALDYLSILTKAFWKPLSANTIYVTLENPQKRRDYEDYILKVFYLQHALEPQELNEIANAVRVVGECRKVVPYPAQMALMVRCTADQVTLVQKIINDMDKPRAEVVLDVYVLEANRNKTRNLAAAIANGTSPGISQTIGFTGGTTGSSTSTTGSTTTTTSSNTLSLANLGRISTNSFSVNIPGGFLQALLQDSTTRVLQNPQIRTVDNKKATLRVGDRYPYATGSFNVGGVGGGVGGVSPYASTQFQFAEVGVNVDITPKIHGNDEISLRVEVEVSNIRDQVNIGGLTQPVIGQRKIGEDIRIRQGEVNVMGGLSTLNTGRTVNGIPGISSLPGLGWLFGTEAVNRNQSELLVVLVPHLVRAPELTDLNLRGVSTGTDQQVKLSYQVKADVNATAPTPTPPVPNNGPPPATPSPQFTPPVPAVTTPQSPPAPTAGGGLPLNPGSALGRALTPQPIPGLVKNRLSLTPPQGQVFLSAPVQVQLRIDEAEELASAPVRIEYDRQLLKLISVTPGGMMSADGNPEDLKVDLDKGEVQLTRPSNGGVSGSGTLLRLTFVSLAKGDAQIRVVDAKLANSQKKALPTTALPELSVKIE